MNPNIHDQFQSSRQLQSNRAIYSYSSPGDLNASITNPALSAPYMPGGNFSQLNLALGLNYGESVDNSQLYPSENVSLPLSNSNFDLNTSRAPGHMLLSDFSGQNLQGSSINQQNMVPNFGDQEMAPTDNNLLKTGSNITENFTNLSSNMQLGNGVMFSGQYSPRNSFVPEKSNAIQNISEIQSLSGNENTQIPWNSNDFANNSRSDFNSSLIFQANNSEQNTTLDNSTPSDNSAANYGTMFSASPSHFSQSSQFFRSYPGDSQLLPPHSSMAPSASNSYVTTGSYSHITNNGSLNSNPSLRTTEQQYNMESDGIDEQSDFSLPQNYGKTNTVPSHGLSNSSNRQASADKTGSQPNAVPTQNQSPNSLVSDLTPSQFLKSLSEFMNRRNTSITQLPYIGTQLVNLWALYSVVTSLGGMIQVNKDAAWSQVAKSLGFNDPTLNAPWALKNCYTTLLYPFEQAHFSQKSVKTSTSTDSESAFSNPSSRRSSSSLQTFAINRDTSPSINKSNPSTMSPRKSQPPGGASRSTTPNQMSPTSFNQHLNKNITKPSGLSTSVSVAPKLDTQSSKTIYRPQTRIVESYGGVDLRLFQQPIHKSLWPKLGDLGHIDIHALTMSVKSKLKMETVNALNVLSMLTVQRNGSLLLEHCDELLESLVDLLDDFLEKLNNFPMLEESSVTSYSLFFEASHAESCQIQGNLHMDKEDLNAFGQVTCCITNIIRNLSFVPENQSFIANHAQFVETLIQYFVMTSHTGINSILLENRKNILIIFSNIGSMIQLVSLETTRLIIEGLVDFLENAGDTYSSLAMETLAKLTVPYENRAYIFQVLFSKYDIFSILLKRIPQDDLQSLTQEKELVVAEMAILTIHNICSIADSQSRRQIAEIPGLVLSLMRLTIRMSERSLPTFDLFRPLCGKILETLKVLSAGNQDIFGYHLDRFVNLFTSNCLDAFVISELIRLSDSQIRNI